MSTATLTNLAITYANQAQPTTEKYTLGTFALRQSSGIHCYGLVNFSMPAPLGATYEDTKLFLYSSSSYAVSRTVRVFRVTQKWNLSSVNWDNFPSYSPTVQAEATRASTVPGDVYELDITDLMNAWSNGSPMYGLLVAFEEEETAARYFYKKNGSTTYAPRIEAQWSVSPRQPQDVSPSNGRAVSIAKPVVTSDFVDLVGNTAMAGMQVQINDIDAWVTPDFDSGDYPTTVPQLPLADTAYAGAVLNVQNFMRVRVKSADNEWSEWSETVTWIRKAKGSVTLVSPSAGSPVVNDSTPTAVWSVAGMVQKHYQLLVWNENKTSLVYTTGKITGTTLSAAVAGASALVPGRNYVMEIRSWDDVDRITTPGDPAYVSDEVAFTFQLGAGTGITGLTVSQVGKSPWALIGFDIATASDSFVVLRDGMVVADNIDPGDLFVSGTHYEYVDRLATPRESHDWQVKPKTNGVIASAGATVTDTINTKTAFLSTLDGEICIPFVNYGIDIEDDDGSVSLRVQNSDEVVTIYQGQSGRSGTFAGVISSAVEAEDGAVTSSEMGKKFRQLRLKENRGRPCVVTYADQSIFCTLSKISNLTPSVFNEEIVYSVSFNLAEKSLEQMS